MKISHKKKPAKNRTETGIIAEGLFITVRKLEYGYFNGLFGAIKRY